MPDVAQSGFSTKFWQPGSSDFPVLLEHYHIHGIIGEGGMGTVFKGYHLNLKRFVAIKTLRLDQQQREDLVGRFKQEMELVGQMDHPNVVRATDAGEKNGVFYLVMEYLSGSDLSRLVVRRGKLPVAFACEVVRQAAQGLAYIHQKTLVHRDIKPSNLMLTANGQIKILDLGLARLGQHFVNGADHEHTPAGYAVGTYSYMAPEQATAGAELGPRADIYSLGCTLFKLLTGKTPYSGTTYDNAAKVMFAHCHVPLSDLPEFASIPTRLRAVLEKKTAKDPAHRYRTAHEVAEALAPFTGDAPTPLYQASLAGVEMEETPLRPLPQPLPDELSRLTGSPQETPRNTPPAAAKPAAPAARRSRRGPVWLGLGCVGLGILGVAWWLFGAPLFVPFRNVEQPVAPQPKPGPEPQVAPAPVAPLRADGLERNLDKIELRVPELLLDRPSSPVGHAKHDPRLWNLDTKLEELHVRGTDTLMFPLGKISKARFSIEAGVSQNPWTGKFGIFWGYREDPFLKAKKGVDFAWFQLMLVEMNRQKDGFEVGRGRGTLWYTPRGELAVKDHLHTSQSVPRPLLGRPLSFDVTLSHKRLLFAKFNDNLPKLCTDAVNQNYENDPYDGGVGVFSLGFDVTFSKVKVIAYTPE